jgi:hypothetical protein
MRNTFNIRAGIFPHDGKNISFKEMTVKVREVYNFAPSFCYFVPNYAAKMLKKKYGSGELAKSSCARNWADLCRRQV